MKNITPIILFSAFIFSASAQVKKTTEAETPKISSSMFGSLTGRQIGPATMSGRITAIDAVNSNARIIYVGTAGGGVWKSTTAGVSFKPVFDKFSQSIGALVIDQKNPEVVWVGTGECNMRNSVSIGTGMYKTFDGGTNWKKVGLDSVERISKIAIDPSNSDIVYVAAPGALWSDSKQRGLFKTSDGGKTWKKILFTDEKTGCADVIIDPKDPNTLYASMWQFRRTPWSFMSGGKGSALYKSSDAGKTWKKIQNGFDGQELGRICLACSPSEPKNLYAIAESGKTALYATTNGGESWTKKSAGQNVTWRPFYFSVITVDPVDPKRIYRPSLSMSISSDGGESFKEASFEGGWVHSDQHALWIDPNNNSHMLLGTDGGMYQSLDRGNSWTMFANLPVSQFYHVTFDGKDPYNVYGGLQDNGSWFAPSQSVNGIENKDWTNVGGGDGFWVQPDGSDPDICYSESQGGEISRVNKATNEYKSIKPYELPGEKKLRCNWNTPIQSSPTNPKTIYFGSQFLYRSRNKGDTWERISPDLTTNDPNKLQQEKSGGLSTDNSGAENHCTIFTIAESPKDENLIWVGTDDGNLQVTENGGGKWSNVRINVPGVPSCTWVSSIEPSTYDKNTAFVTFDGHATGDMKPYIFKTTNLGKTWTKISTSDIKGYVHKIKQDIVKPDLLFAGSEFGLWMSLDAGKNWVQYTAGVPPVAVRDIQIHPKTNDLILATHGRGIIIIDDITPIRNLTPDVLTNEMAFLPTRPYYLTSGKYGGAWPSGGGYSGPNSTEEYVVMYYFKDRVTSGEVKVEFYNDKGELIKSLPAGKRKGINVVSWDMRGKPARVAGGVKLDYSGFFGPLVGEGTYTVKLIHGDKSIEKKIELKYDPAAPYSIADRQLRQQTLDNIKKLQEDLAYLSDKIKDVQEQAKAKTNTSPDKMMNAAADAFVKKLDEVKVLLAASIEGTAITGEEKIREKIADVYFNVNGFEGRPTDSQIERLKGLRAELDDADKKASAIMGADMAKLNLMVKKNKMEEITVMTWQDWDKKTTKP